MRYYKNMCFPIDGPRNYLHNDIGFNYRMSNVIAAIGLAQVEKADTYRSMRIRNNALYKDLLKDVPGIQFQPTPDGCLNVAWMNAVVVNPEEYGHTKDELREHLKQNGIDTRLLFEGMHKQPSLRKYGCNCNGAYPVAEHLTAHGFYLPSASSLSADNINYICQTIKHFAR